MRFGPSQELMRAYARMRATLGQGGRMEGLGVAIGSRRDVSTEEIVSMARLADRLGYASVWVGESWGRDAFTLLTMIACHTTERAPRHRNRASVQPHACPAGADCGLS